MPDASDVLWFKGQFRDAIEAAVAGTPLTTDFLAALACQETGEVWPLLRRKGLPVAEVLALCVGDTLDADKGRRAFPATKAELLAAPRGDEMFAVARDALVRMATHIPAYANAAARPHKFCHGFGLFQRDLQFFRSDPGYFLNRDYERFDGTLAQCLAELKRALAKLGFADRASLSDAELAAVGIVYNTGGFRPAKGLKQGHFDGRRFYGEALFDFLRLAHTVALPGGGPPPIAPPPPGQAAVVPPAAVTATGPRLKVRTLEGMLRVRSEPRFSRPPQANVVGHLPDGHRVRAVSGVAVNGFLEIQTTLHGALLHGFSSHKLLVADEAAEPDGTPPAPVAPGPATAGVSAVTMPRRAGSVTRRRDAAGAHSLNETGQPRRTGTSAEELRAELAAIVDWLAVDDARHLRYQPHGGATFCNVYAHDYCHLAGVFLPRVWWTPRALLRLAAGETVAPLLGDTIEELRANDLFRWLRDFGAAFGWRQTGTPTTLQREVDQGAIGLIVARRKEDGRSGHVALVVPETAAETARRDAAGEVVAPLQSQAGASNFRYGRGRAAWWNEAQFAESAFWLHA